MNITYPTALLAALFVGPVLAESAEQSKTVLDEVIVTSSRVETPVREVGAAVSVLNQEEIALRGYQGVADLLRTQPSISVSNSGGAGKQTALRIRGEEGYRTLVLIDGVEVSDPTGTQIGPQVQHLGVSTDIERIEILRGPQGFIYGADAGGVVNIVTRSGAQASAALAAEAGHYDSQKVSAYAAGGNDALSAFISVNQYNTDGFNTLVADDSGEADGNENTTLHGKFAVQIDPQWRAQLVARDTKAYSEYDRCGFYNAQGQYQPTHDCASDFDQRIVKLSLDYAGEQVSHHWAVAHSDVSKTRIAGGMTVAASDGSIHKLEYLSRVRLSPQWQWVAGGDYKNESMDGEYSDPDDRRQLGVFVEAQGNYADAVYISIGARHDDHQIFGEHISSRIAAAYVQDFAHGGTLKYRTSWGTGFRAPSLYEEEYNRTAQAELAPLTEETSAGADLGIEYYGVNGAVVQLGLFDQKIENEIYYDLLAYTGYLQGLGVSHSQGVEVSLEYPVADRFKWIANYTFNKTLAADDTLRLRRPKHLLNVGLQARFMADRLTVLVNARAARDAENSIYGVGRVPLDDYQVVDLSVVHRVLENLTVQLRLENALDKKYQEVTGYNTAERSAYAGVQMQF